MDLGATDKVRPLIAAVRAMVRDEIMPLEEEYHAEVGRDGDPFKPTKRFIEIRESLKAKARAKGATFLEPIGPGELTVEEVSLVLVKRGSRSASLQRSLSLSAGSSGTVERS